jgi:hypothetical protein
MTSANASVSSSTAIFLLRLVRDCAIPQSRNSTRAASCGLLFVCYGSGASVNSGLRTLAVRSRRSALFDDAFGLSDRIGDRAAIHEVLGVRVAKSKCDNEKCDDEKYGK